MTALAALATMTVVAAAAQEPTDSKGRRVCRHRRTLRSDVAHLVTGAAY